MRPITTRANPTSTLVAKWHFNCTTACMNNVFLMFLIQVLFVLTVLFVMALIEVEEEDGGGK